MAQTGFTDQRWRAIFEEFITHMRIDSKELAAQDERGSKLDLWTSQRMFLDFLCAGLDDGCRMFLVNKARQLGVTTVSLAVDIFWLAMHPGLIGCLVVDNDTNRDTFRVVLRRYIGSFPVKFFGKFGISKGGDNKAHMRFTNGSRLDFLVAGKSKTNWAESRGYAFGHLTEVSSYGSVDGLASFRESIAEHHPNRLFIYESTAKGYNHWKTMWEEFGRDQDTKRRLFIGWWSKDLNRIERDDPRWMKYGIYPPDMEEQEKITLTERLYGYRVSPEQLAWYRWRASDQSADDASLRQNLPWTADESFVLSGFSFFQIRKVQTDIDRVIGNPDDGIEPVTYKAYRYHLGEEIFSAKMERITDASRINEVELRVWEEPVKDAQYVIGCDPAFGRNDWADRSAISVWRCFADKMVQVAEYATPDPETRQIAWVLAHLAGAYKNCIVNIELGGPGHAVFTEWNAVRSQLRAEMFAQKVKDLDWEDFLDNARQYLYHRPDSMGAGYAYHTQAGFSLTHRMLNHMRDMYSTYRLIINSLPMLEEMSIVTQDGSHIGAPKGQANKDDRVFAAALAILAYKDWLEQRLIAEGYTYEVAMRREHGNPNELPNIVDRMVGDFFRRAEERANMEPEPDAWLQDRGFE